MIKTKISVIIPVYNKGPHISRSISSVLKQTYGNFELIIVCDPSTDNSNAEVEKFTDERIKIFYRDEPGPGGYAARNLGIEKASGHWIAFLDADDEWFPIHLERYSYLIEKYPMVNFLCSGYLIKEDDNEFTNSFYNIYKSKGTQRLSFLEYIKESIKGIRPAWTSVVCIKNNNSAKDLFPDGIANRGGDIFAWVRYLSIEKEMIWSEHIGAIYYCDSINMVTKSSKSNPDLFRYEYKITSQNISRIEKKYLRKYINRRFANSYFRNKYEENIVIGGILEYMYCKGDVFFILKTLILSILPKNIYRVLKKGKSYVH